MNVKRKLSRSSGFPQPVLPSQLAAKSQGRYSFLYTLNLKLFRQWRYTNRLALRGLQLQVQLRTLTGFPCIVRLRRHDCLVSAAKVQTIFELNKFSGNFLFVKSPIQLRYSMSTISKSSISSSSSMSSSSRMNKSVSSPSRANSSWRVATSLSRCTMAALCAF